MTPRRILALLALVVLVVIVSVAVRQQNSVPAPGAGEVVPPGDAAPATEGTDPGPASYPDPLTPESLHGWLADEARARASRPWEAPDTTLPAVLAELDYDAWRQIRFRPERAVWGDETPFRLHLFHRGSTQKDRVAMHLVDEGGVRELPFEPGRFRYEGDAAPLAEAVSADLGWAGFRVHHPMNRPDVADEVVVFLGASYFRLLGPGHVHGLSTRGLAVDVADPGGEEFPRFRAFWVFRPPPGSEALTILALLDSPSVSGAYRFDLTPGQGWESDSARPTRMEVDARLFARRDVGKLGVAPLTSMYLHGPERAAHFDDVRPRVHDSQGLLMRTGAGEWIWRPLSNGPGLRVTSLRDREPGGFGLVQRARDFSGYLDLEARYHRRPSEWVEPLAGEWGPGGVELVEIPTPSEFNDNIVASWVPDAPFRAGDARRYRYRLRTFDDRLPDEELARVTRWRVGRAGLPGAPDRPAEARRFLVDFEGGTVPSPGSAGGEADGAPPEAVLQPSSGDVSDLRVLPLPDPGGWRVSFRLDPAGNRSSDLRLFLVRGGETVSETWSYLWDPGSSR